MAGLLLQRPAHAWTVMAAAALALLVAEPLNALDAGFQLSFAGVAGLLAYRRRLGHSLPGGLPATLREGLATGLAATVATFPIAAIRFGQFAPIGLVATIVATPVVGLALPGVALLILLAPVAPPVAALLAPGVELLLGAFLATAHAAAWVPGGHFAVAAPTMAALLVIAAGGIFWLASRRDADVRPASSPVEERRSRRQRGLRVLQAVAAGGALLAWSPAVSPGADHVELHVIDVGQGDAIAIRTPHGRWLLVDAGMRTARTDMGARRVVPYLLRAGARRLDVLLLTHSDADHLGGAASVLRALAVDVVMDPGAPAASDQYLETIKAAAAEPARWLAPAAGQRLALDGVELRFFHPAGPLLDAPVDPNDNSLVFRLGYGRFAALFMGDAPQAVERQLAARHGRALDAMVLKVGHHGSRTSSSDELLDAARPGLAVVSVGRENRYGHPDPGVLARLVRSGAQVLRTDRHGSMVIRADRTGSIRVGASR
jgi:competence protein ComEC